MPPATEEAVVGEEQFKQLVVEAVDRLPDEFPLENVAFIVEDEPNAELLLALGVHDLFGHYHGVPLNKPIVAHSSLPSCVFIYRGSHVRWCSEHQALRDRVYKTVVHEIGHHFGFSEDDLIVEEDVGHLRESS